MLYLLLGCAPAEPAAPDPLGCTIDGLPSWPDALTYTLIGGDGDHLVGAEISAGDLDGDGLDDLGMAGAYSPRAYVVLGSTLTALPPGQHRLPEVADYTLELEEIADEPYEDRYSGNGASVTVTAGAIYVNNSSVDASYPVAYRADWTSLRKRGPGAYRIREIADVTFEGIEPAYTPAKVCDVNGDGAPDVFLDAYLLLGPVAGSVVNLDYSAELMYRGAPGNWCGGPSACRDINMDGIDDFVLACAEKVGDSWEKSISVYYGGPKVGDGPVDLRRRDVAIEFGAGPTLELTEESVADWDGDGHMDLAFNTRYHPGYRPGGSEVLLYRGGERFLPSGTVLGRDDRYLAVTADGEGDESLGEGLSIAGDLNADGYPEVVIGNPGVARDGGRLYVGSCSGPGDWNGSDFATTIFEAGVQAEDWPTDFAHSVVASKDVDGDGRSDLIIAAPYFNSPELGAANYAVGAVHVALLGRADH